MEQTPEIDNFIEDSDTIIEGLVENISYYDCNGLPWTCLQVRTKDVLFGSINIEAGEIIDIFVMEGYAYSDNTQTSLIECIGEDQGLHQIGDKSIYILSKEPSDSIFGKNTYMRTYSCFSEFRFNSSKNIYTGYNAEGNMEENSKDVKYMEQWYKWTTEEDNPHIKTMLYQDGDYDILKVSCFPRNSDRNHVSKADPNPAPKLASKS